MSAKQQDNKTPVCKSLHTKSPAGVLFSRRSPAPGPLTLQLTAGYRATLGCILMQASRVKGFQRWQENCTFFGLLHLSARYWAMAYTLTATIRINIHTYVLILCPYTQQTIIKTMAHTVRTKFASISGVYLSDLKEATERKACALSNEASGHMGTIRRLRPRLVMVTSRGQRQMVSKVTT